MSQYPQAIDRITVILPSYNPTDRILDVILNVSKQGFKDFIIINDGSCADRRVIFDSLLTHQPAGCCVTVLHHEMNRGKGAALKTGFAFFLEHRPNAVGVVTIDDDGQHLPADIRRCAEKMQESGKLVLGCRDFSNKSVPKKSLVGNRFTSMLFKIQTGISVFDTQTGLRSIPAAYLPACLRLPGNRFEYEMNVLLAAERERFMIAEVPIETVYIEGNKGTHFRAFNDSVRILLQFAKYSAGALLSFFIDIFLFYFFMRLRWENPSSNGVSFFSVWNSVFISAVIARIVSAAFNFIYNKNVVFGRSQKTGRALIRYIILCSVVLVVSSQAVTVISWLPYINSPGFLVFVKAAVDAGLFLVNYFIQKKWVYLR